MKLYNGFLPEEKKVTITMESNLLKKYYSNFNGLFMNAKNELPEGLKVDQQSSTKAIVSFPLPTGSTVNPMSETSMSVSIDSRNFNRIQDVINKFISGAVWSQNKEAEFLPLHGYPVEDLQKDIVRAAKEKKTLYIIKTYKEFLDMEKTHDYKFTQYVLEYGSDEYTNVVLMFMNGEMKELRKIYEPKLTFTEWI